MLKSAFSPLGFIFQAYLVKLRESAGLSQRQLAKKLGREPSFVARIEQGERRVDFIEFYWICLACKTTPERAAATIMRKFGAAKGQTHSLMAKGYKRPISK